jgi:16S rRNA (cytosine967-C5)-methyltransferase
MAKRQMTILNTLWPLLKQGGQLLYVTCSVFAEENNQQIEQFMKQHLDVKIIPLGKLDDPYVLQGNQLIPSPMHDGFYYAILQKI